MTSPWRHFPIDFYKMNWYWATVTLTFDPISPISIESKQPFSENRVQIGASVWLEFCSQEKLDTHKHTDTHTYRDIHTDKLQWKYNPSMISWRCIKNKQTNKQKQSCFRIFVYHFYDNLVNVILLLSCTCSNTFFASGDLSFEL